MRKLALFVVVLGIAALVLIFYPAYAEKPVLNAEGAMGIRIDPAFPIPEYHSPLEYWKTHHMDMLNNDDLTQLDCVHCHDPETSCNNCHNYVGVAVIETQCIDCHHSNSACDTCHITDSLQLMLQK